MEVPTLQHVLESNYGITERIWVEGKFIAFLGNSQSATCLVSLGLGQKNFYMARVVLSGPVIDYELLSLVPLPLVSFAYNNALKMLKVRSKFKVTQVFQLCTNQHQKNVWEDFTTYIRYMGINKRPEVWFNQELAVSHDDDNIEACVEDDGNCASLLTQFYQASSMNSLSCRCISQLENETGYQSQAHIQASRSVSLPALQSTSADDRQFGSLCRRHSMDCADIRFESFVNDAPKRSSEFMYNSSSCSWNGSADDLSRVHSNKLNVSNNYAVPSVTETGNSTDARKKKGFFSKMRRFFSCKKRPSS